MKKELDQNQVSAALRILKRIRNGEVSASMSTIDGFDQDVVEEALRIIKKEK